MKQIPTSVSMGVDVGMCGGVGVIAECGIAIGVEMHDYVAQIMVVDELGMGAKHFPYADYCIV